MTEKKRTVYIAAAGTGGHVMPGLAVARELKARGWEVAWLGTTTGMESDLVGCEGIPFMGLNFQGVRGRGLLGAVKGGLKLIQAFFAARSVLAEARPTIIFSTGGYIAVPVGFAARSLGIPLVMMNCDADLLMSTNTLLKVCQAVACGFAGGARSFAKSKGVITGNPVRAEIVALPPTEERFAEHTGPLKLFVFGGSLGAKVLNDVLPEALALLPPEERPVVVHQTGKNRDEEVREHYARVGVEAEVLPFITDMAARYRECDVVLCRSGATSVSELCVGGVPAILVPFVAKTTAHQLGNARYMVSNDAAILMEQKDCTPEAVKNLLASLTREKLLKIGQSARALGHARASENVADLIERISEGKGPQEAA